MPYSGAEKLQKGEHLDAATCRLSNIVNASQTERFGISFEDLYPLLSCVNIEIVVRKDHGAIGRIDLYALCVIFCRDYDLITFNFRLQFGILEFEMLGSGKEDAALRYDFSLNDQFIRIIVIQNVGLAKINLIQCQNGKRRNRNGLTIGFEYISAVITQIGKNLSAYRFTRIIGNGKLCLGFVILIIGLHNHVRTSRGLSNLRAGEQNGRIEAFSVIVERFESSVIVDA